MDARRHQVERQDWEVLQQAFHKGFTPRFQLPSRCPVNSVEHLRSGNRRESDGFARVGGQQLIDVERAAFCRDEHTRINQDSHTEGCICGWLRVIDSTRLQYSASGCGVERRNAARSATVKTSLRPDFAGRFIVRLPDARLRVVIRSASFRRAMVGFLSEVCVRSQGALVQSVEADTTAPAACTGDCDGKGSVSVDELITLVKHRRWPAQEHGQGLNVAHHVGVGLASVLSPVDLRDAQLRHSFPMKFSVRPCQQLVAQVAAVVAECRQRARRTRAA
jgi:hypothetical protein